MFQEGRCWERGSGAYHVVMATRPARSLSSWMGTQIDSTTRSGTGTLERGHGTRDRTDLCVYAPRCIGERNVQFSPS